MAENLKFDARLAEGIAYFEQMRDLMPEDRTTLEFLVVAYAQLGENEKAESALGRLAQLLAETGDLSALEGLIPRLEAAKDEHAKAMLLRAKAMTSSRPDLTPEVPREKTPAEKIIDVKKVAVEAERVLVDDLLNDGVLTEAEHHMVIEHLNATPFDDRIFLISALQILEKENSAVCEKTMAAIADKYSVPPIPFGLYEIRSDLLKMVESEIVRIRGVVPFAQMGNLTLVALLNPCDEELKKDVTKVFGLCRFYLSDPAAMEKCFEARFSETSKEGS